jgi:methyl-accepting chemotaxis protein
MRLSISAKLLGGFGVILILMGISGWLAISRLGSVDHAAKAINDDRKATASAAALELQLRDIDSRLKEAIASDLAASQSTGADKELFTNRVVTELAAIPDEQAQVSEELKQAAAEPHWSEEQRQILSDLESSSATVLKDTDAAVKDLESGHVIAAAKTAVAGEFNDAFDNAVTDVNKLQESVDKDAAANSQRADSTYSSARTLIIVFVVIAVLLGLGVALFLSRTISGALKNVVQRLTSVQEHCLADLNTGMTAMAGGDLTLAVTPVTPKIDTYPNDEVGQAAAAVNDIIDKMVATIGSYNRTRMSLTELLQSISQTVQSLTDAKTELGQSADQAAQATQQIAQATNQVADGTNQTAKSVHDVSNSMSELDDVIGQVTQGAGQTAKAVQEVNQSVAQLELAATDLDQTAKVRVAQAADDMAANAQAATEGARVASDTAQTGARMVQLTIDGMQRIKETVNTASGEITRLGTRSQEIGNIVAVIDDIAAQTNLLALNAAIEAARAGEQGRGFAVVADEVRKLAERVASATKEISGLITGIQKSVESSVKVMADGARETEAGASVAADAGGALQEILAAVAAVNEQMVRIADGSATLRASGAEMIQVVDNVRMVVDGVGAAVGSIAAVAEQNNSATEQMRNTAREVGDAIQSIAAVAEENSAATEEVSASSEEMTAQVEEVTAAAHSLGFIADDLSAKVGSFRLAQDSGRQPVALRPDSGRKVA